MNLKRKILANGLHVLVHEDHTTPLAAFNVVYNVGSRDENSDHTGMAHLMEHFMFCGSKNVPNYDNVLQNVGAINNAYTSQDLTNYYIVLPAKNVETAFWLESDRMLSLAFEQNALDVQKHVVIEEFKESFLNRPYGDLMMLFNELVYKQHPYQWLPIGKKTEHIAEVDMPMMKAFAKKFYCPNNAVLTIAGNVSAEEMFTLAEKWFGDIPAGLSVPRNYPVEPLTTQPRKLSVEREVPSDVLIKGWLMCDRMSPDYYAYDLLSDMFGTGQSSYLYQKLVVEKNMFTDISASITGTRDAGIFMISGRPMEGISVEQADDALSEYIYGFKYDEHLNHDLQKVQHRAESILLNNEIKIDDRASAIAVGETMSSAEYFMDEQQHYFDVTEEQIRQLTKHLFDEKYSHTLYYKTLSEK